MLKVLINKLNKLYDEGLVIKQTHPFHNLIIWNYSEKVQYDNLWHTHPLLLQTRGLVTDEFGTIVARPFKKFFNMEEGKHTPTTDFEVFEKVDGSCIILFYYNHEWVFASRGSFTSEQSVKAKELSSKYPLHSLDKQKTYIFEIIY